MKSKLISQISKFGVVGIINTAVDIIVLNMLIIIFGFTAGVGFAVLKGFSFLAAVTNSYFLNKLWTFRDPTRDNLVKAWQFLTVSLGGLFVNVSVASLIVNTISPLAILLDTGQAMLNLIGIIFSNEQIWANFGTLVAVGASMIWNFIGYKFFVFKK